MSGVDGEASKTQHSLVNSPVDEERGNLKEEDDVFENKQGYSSGTPPPCTQRRQGSSFKALKTAVKNLASLDDFVCEKLGVGFFSDVYKVIHRQTNQIMVLKMNTLSSNRRNVLGEVQLLNKLSHPNILRFMGVCVHEGQLHALTEFCDGGNLKDLLSTSTKLDWGCRLHLALDTAEGMKYVHSKGIMHRDLTSMNCLIKLKPDGGYQLLIADFGLACAIPRDNEAILSIVGTPFWMAPECLKQKPYNERADLFSYGIVLCEIIARIPADPDYLPRLENFGLDSESFIPMCNDCPSDFLQLAIQCCSMDPLDRPVFEEIVDQIINIKATVELHEALLSVVLMTDREKDSLASTRFKGHKRAKSESSSPPGEQLPFTPTPLLRSNSERCSSTRMVPALSQDKVNPFDTPYLKGGKTKLVSVDSDLTSILSTYMPSTPPSSPVFTEDSIIKFEQWNTYKRRRSHSLPTSPIFHRRPSPESDGSVLSASYSFTFPYGASGSKGKLPGRDGVLDLCEQQNKSKLNCDKESDESSLQGNLQLPKETGIGLGLDSGLSSLCDDDIQRINDIAISVPDNRRSPDPLHSSSDSTTSSVPST